MSNCYLCGLSNKHTYDCPKYVTVSVVLVEPGLKVVSTKPEEIPSVSFIRQANVWRMARINKGNIIPNWAEFGWHLNNADKKSWSKSTLEELAKAWEISTSNGAPWLLGSGRIGKPHQDSEDLLVFSIKCT